MIHWFELELMYLLFNKLMEYYYRPIDDSFCIIFDNMIYKKAKRGYTGLR